MKYLFLASFLILLLAGVATRLSEPDAGSELPVIYWVIDPAPARGEQIELFHKWQIKNGHGSETILKSMEDVKAFRARRWSSALKKAIQGANTQGALIWDEQLDAAKLPISVKIPATELRMDSANNKLEKKLIQGLSGVGPDIIEAYGSAQLRYLAVAGMLAGMNEAAPELGFEPSSTYKALRPDLSVDGVQYTFPRNVTTNLYWVNKATFKKHQQPLPASRLDLNEFERRGKQFVEAANTKKGQPLMFFANRVDPLTLRRSLGLSKFNETLTRCTLDDSRNIRVLKLIHKWTYQDRIIPSAADRSSFSAAGGWASMDFQLFHKGQFAMIISGRWALMSFRRFGNMELSVTEPPHGGFPNSIFSSGCTTVYRGSKHQGLAMLFAGFMASEDYNLQIVRSGDALPPNPKYTETEAFLRPPDYPNEWGSHKAFRDAAQSIAIVYSLSPFVLPTIVDRLDRKAIEGFMADQIDAKKAAASAAEDINAEIQLAIRDNAPLRKQYEVRCAQQITIDTLRKAGKKVPAELIHNPFHLAYYAKQGWLKE